MARRANMVRLEALRASLEQVVRTVEALERDQSLTRLARQDAERWEPVMNALYMALAGDEVGMVSQVLTVITTALEE